MVRYPFFGGLFVPATANEGLIKEFWRFAVRRFIAALRH